MSRVSALCLLLALVSGCSSSRVSEPVIDPEAVLEKDLPPPEATPVEIRCRAERDPRTGDYAYVYTVSNGTPWRITDFHIGLTAKQGHPALRQRPLGLTEDGRMPGDRYDAPAGWALLYERGSLGSLTWTAQDDHAILPGESLTGFRVAVAARDEAYERSGWVVIVTGEPGTYTGTLGRAEDMPPLGDPVDRLGRLRISPRFSRGDVTVRYRTHPKARPIVAVLDSRGEVVRKYPQDRRRIRERQIVWDRRDGSDRLVPPGDYYIRVRYGFTERYGRVTLVER